MLDSCKDKKDIWIIYEVCKGKNLNEGISEVKGEFYNRERIYMVHHSFLYYALRNNKNLIKDFVSKMGSVLDLFR